MIWPSITQGLIIGIIIVIILLLALFIILFVDYKTYCLKKEIKELEKSKEGRTKINEDCSCYNFCKGNNLTICEGCTKYIKRAK